MTPLPVDRELRVFPAQSKKSDRRNKGGDGIRLDPDILWRVEYSALRPDYLQNGLFGSGWFFARNLKT
jgi:hypothetical protein